MAWLAEICFKSYYYMKIRLLFYVVAAFLLMVIHMVFALIRLIPEYIMMVTDKGIFRIGEIMERDKEKILGHGKEN